MKVLDCVCLRALGVGDMAKTSVMVNVILYHSSSMNQDEAIVL